MKSPSFSASSQIQFKKCFIQKLIFFLEQKENYVNAVTECGSVQNFVTFSSLYTSAERV